MLNEVRAAAGHTHAAHAAAAIQEAQPLQLFHSLLLDRPAVAMSGTLQALRHAREVLARFGAGQASLTDLGTAATLLATHLMGAHSLEQQRPALVR